MDSDIKAIFFSSKFVEKQFAKYFKEVKKSHPNIQLITLPSPSPRYAVISKNRKIEIYKEILPKLQDVNKPPKSNLLQ